jgi:hypothetical protein
LAADINFDRSFIVASNFSRISLAAIAAVVTTTAFAQGGQGIGLAGTYEGPPHFGPGQKTRAEVREELEASRAPTPAAQEERNREIVRSVTGVINDNQKTAAQ